MKPVSLAGRRALVAALTAEGHAGPDSWMVGGLARRGLVEPECDGYNAIGEERFTGRFLLTEAGWTEARRLAAEGVAP